MKKLIIIGFLLISTVVGTVGCSENNISNEESSIETETTTELSEKDIIDIAYNNLTSEEKAEIEGHFDETAVYEVVLKEEMGVLNDDSYIGKEVYLIDFQTAPGNIGVFVSNDTYKFLGYGCYLEW